MYTRKKIFIIIFLGFISSIILSNFYIIKYDKYRDDGKSHIMIKDETLYHWYEGAKIADDVKKGKNFFSSGDDLVFTKPLPQRLVSIYSLISGQKLIDDWVSSYKVALGGKLPFLIIQSLFYYLALIYLVTKISKIFKIENCFYIVFFLAFEHTIFQFHSSFWTESFYLTLQILLLGLLFNNSYKTLDNFLIGIVVGVLFLQRTVGAYYLIPIIIYFIFYYKRKSIKPIIASVMGYTLIVLLIGVYNYKKTDVLFFIPLEGKYGAHHYFFVKVFAEKNKISVNQARKEEAQKAYIWLKNNNFKFKNEPDLDKIANVLNLSTFVENKKDKIEYYNYINSRSVEIFIESPLIAFKQAITGVVHYSILNPIFVYYNYEHRGKNKKPGFIKSQTHKKWIPYRIVYSLLIYFVCFFGLIYLFKQKKYQLLLLLILSILYYLAVAGWYGKTRLFAPNLIYLSFFFGNGMVFLINRFKRKQP